MFELQPEHIFLGMGVVTGRGRLFEPTFVLNGTPYLCNHLDELQKAGPDFIRMALYETYRHMWATIAEETAGTLSRDEYDHRMAELVAGACCLREMLPEREPLFPNGGFVTRH